MLHSRPFSFAHARPPEGKAFAARQLVGYHEAARRAHASTATIHETIKALKAEPERRGARAALASLAGLAAMADAHNEALDLGLSQLGPTPQS